MLDLFQSSTLHFLLPVLRPRSVEADLGVESESGALEEVDLGVCVPHIHHHTGAAVTGHPQHPHTTRHGQGHRDHDESHDADCTLDSDYTDAVTVVTEDDCDLGAPLS